MKSFLNEFKEFAVRGSAIELAVGVIIGAAFGKIVSSLVGDVLMPLIGLAIGGINWQKFIVGPVALGNFLQAIVDFVIVALVVFLFVRAVNAFKNEKKSK